MLKFTKLLSLLLCLVMLLQCVPMVGAVTAEKEAVPTAPLQAANPPACQRPEPEIAPLVVRQLDGKHPVRATYCTTEDAAAAQMRADMVAHKSSIVIYYKSKVMTQEFIDYIYWEIFQRAIAHTGNVQEGDHLYREWNGYAPELDYYKSGGYYYCTFTYNMKYMTTAAQEAQLVAGVEEFVEEHITDSMSNYGKFRVIYDWICQNITYDHEHLGDETYLLQYTAYAAMFDRTCVCAGYADLLYMMLLEAGVDNRQVTGDAGGYHAWNIVQMDDGYYYNADSTWDAGMNWQEYSYCLVSPATFSDHTAEAKFDEAFWNSYPMGQADYIDESVFMDKTAAALELRNIMKSRENYFKLYVSLPSKPTDALIDDLYAQAVAHTGVPDEGDYLDKHVYSIDGSVSYTYSKGRYLTTVDLTVVYYSTLEQEYWVTVQIDTWFSRMITTGMTSYEKFDAIYSWITYNVSYGYDGSSPGYGYVHTALFYGNAGSNGFSALLYRMLLKAGVDCRCIDGLVNNNTGVHHWNIVKLDGLYYNVDPGWEAHNAQQSNTYRYRLKCDANFTNHTRDAQFATMAFYQAYPMGTTDYVPGAKFDITVSRMSLGNSLEFQFAVPKSAMANWNGAYAVIERKGANGSHIVTIPQVLWPSVTVNGVAHWAIVYDRLAAKEMADTFYVTIYDGNCKVVSNVRTDSVRDYVARVFSAQSVEGKTMMVDMLNYGAAAQKKFGYKTDDLANKNLTATQKSYGTTTTPETADSLTKGTNYFGSRLILESRIQMQVGFKGLDQTMYATYSYTDRKGKTQNVRVEGTDFVYVGSGVYGVELNKVVYADSRSLVTIQVFKADGTLVASAKDSIESYVNRSGNTELFVALMRFADAAKEYLK